MATAIDCVTEDGKPVVLTDRIALGAQGAVYRVDGSELLAKLLIETQDQDRARRRIRALIAHGHEPRAAALAGARPPRAAWPLVPIRREREGYPGFLMVDLAEGRLPLEAYVTADLRTAEFPHATWLEALHAAYDLARLVADMHAADYVLGDLKPENLWVDGAGRVALCDVDSVQFSGAGEFFPCAVGSPGYAAPELIDASERTPDRHSDAFSLAVLAYRLLMGGAHPFYGMPGDGSAYSGLNDNILHGRSRLLGPGTVRIRPGTPPPGLLPRSLRELFRRCFDDTGRAVPDRRPTPGEWASVLYDAAQPSRLRRCGEGSQHIYTIESPWCPWCDLSRHGTDCYPDGASRSETIP